eukprot:1633724-Pyramimonas_sp.AAC.1
MCTLRLLAAPPLHYVVRFSPGYVPALHELVAAAVDLDDIRAATCEVAVNRFLGQSEYPLPRHVHIAA